METGLFFLFALVSSTYAQYMSSWGSSTGYTNQMQMPNPYNMHMPFHHYGGLREASAEVVPYATKTEGVLPYQAIKAKIPTRVGLHDYSLFNVNAPDHEEMQEHVIYRQSLADGRRPVLGVISLFQSPIPMAAAGTKTAPGYQDTSALDDLMTCVGMDVNEPLKIHQTEPRIILGRGIPYYMSSMHKIKQ